MKPRTFLKKPLPAAIALAVFAFGLPFAITSVSAQTTPASPATPAANSSKTPEEIAAEKAKADARKESQQLETVIVTASGRAQAASSVPYNVTAISEEALREANITDIKKFIQQSPSINAPANSARFADSVTVRGLNVSPVGANNIEYFTRSTLAYYLDDTPLPNIAFRIKDITRVETLLGPQGTLYGAGSLGGTVRYITNQPEFSRLSIQGNTSIFSAQGGRLSHDTDAVANIPLSKNLAFRASISRLDDGGYTDRISNPYWRVGELAWETKPNANQNVYKNDDWNRVNSGRAALAWKLTDDLKITLSHAQQSQLAHGTSGTTIVPLAIANATSPADYDAYVRDPRGFSPCAAGACAFTDPTKTPFLAGKDVIASRYPEFADRDFRMSSLELDWNLGFANLRSSTSTYRDSRVGQGDYAGQGVAFYYDLGDAGGKFDSGRSAFLTFDNTYKGVSHETRLTSTGTGPLSWIAGLYYANKKSSLKFSEFLPGLDAYNVLDRAAAGGLADEGYRENLASEYKETAFFGELAYKITPQWTVTGGARIFNYEDIGISQIRDYSFDLVNSNVKNTTKQNGKSYYKFNTAYNFTPDALAYATVSQGFRRGGVNGFRDFGGKTIAADIQSYKPDSTTNYEIGVKGTFLNRRMYVQADVYQIDWKDVQTYLDQSVDNGFPINGTTNGPSARSRGFEFSNRFNVTDNWQVNFATAYTQAKWTASKTVCRYTDGTGCRDPYLKGGILGGSPDWKHSLGVRYTTTFSNGTTGFVALAGRYTGKVPVDRGDDPTSPVDSRDAYSLFDLRAGMLFDKLDVTLWVENIANKRVEVSSQPDSVIGRRVIFTAPRTYGLNLSYAFK
jgi:iron complex outermembrane recepter protein